MMPKLMEEINQANLKAEVPAIAIGETIRVHVMIREGEKERVQIFPGTVIAIDGGGSTETFTVRRVSHGVGVERVFPLHSPHVVKVEVEKRGHVRRAKLYFLRNLTGKKARLSEKARK